MRPKAKELHYDHLNDSCDCCTEEFGFTRCINFLLLLVTNLVA